MRYFIDTEYLWSPIDGRIEPVSIAVVAEDGREFYAVSNRFNPRHASQWVKDNVLALLPERHPDPYDSPRLKMEACAWMKPERIQEKLLAFIGDDIPEFWGDYSAFDYVVLSMLMGEFSDWPQGWPMHINDLQQDAIPSLESATPHNALADARAIRDSWNWAFQEPKPDHPCAICGEREREIDSELCDRCAVERYRANRAHEKAIAI